MPYDRLQKAIVCISIILACHFILSWCENNISFGDKDRPSKITYETLG